MNLFTLSAVLQLDKTGFDRGVEQAKDSAGQVEEAMGNASSGTEGIGTAWGGVVEKLASVGTMAGMTAIITKAWEAATAVASMGDEIDKMSIRLGMSAKEYQAWTGVFSEADLDLSSSTRAFNNFFSTLASGSDEAIEGLAQLGINYDEFMQLGTSDQMATLVTQFQAMAATGTDVRGLAQTFFGTAAGTNMLTLLAGSGFAEAFDFYSGNAASDDAVSNSAKFNDALTKFNTLIESLKLDAFTETLGFLTTAIGELTDFLMIITGKKQPVSDQQIAEGVADVVQRQAAAAGVELVQQDLVEQNGGDGFAANRQAIMDLYYALRNSGELKDGLGGTVSRLAADEDATATAADVLQIAGTYFGSNPEVLQAISNLQSTYVATADSADGATSSISGLSDAASSAASALYSIGASDGSHAIGAGYIPFDGYRAVLHRGEMVLTAAQAASYRNGSSSSGSAIGSLADAMSRVSVKMDGKTVGSMVTQTVSENINNAANRGRYAW